MVEGVFWILKENRKTAVPLPPQEKRLGTTVSVKRHYGVHGSWRKGCGITTLKCLKHLPDRELPASNQQAVSGQTVNCDETFQTP